VRAGGGMGWVPGWVAGAGRAGGWGGTANADWVAGAASGWGRRTSDAMDHSGGEAARATEAIARRMANCGSPGRFRIAISPDLRHV
jgi:hypothetical protein